MKLSRLFQPRNPAFWVMIALNVLSSAFAWILRTHPLNPLGLAVVAGLALANAMLGMWFAWRLVREDGDNDRKGGAGRGM
ncbi:hypothetical protein SAMN05421829_10383 [Aromatoleum tolulyticum]|uniref:Uncharacterized protein n=1 Tax=Aromatoleum tolulyticum TaxID=34027 RepID=A0A1N6R420_9RHOO|nr:hypothetical protein [Aromatoleum tolulyticum]SIQ23635.1 hypothetical protein SAMN05421829_10383 [Aromatoleum tolulyticum]